MNTRVLAAEDAFVNNSTECSTSDSNNDDDSDDDDDDSDSSLLERDGNYLNFFK